LEEGNKTWLAKLIARLLPKQENSGVDGVQVGRAGGDVTVVHLTQHIHNGHAPERPPTAISNELREQQSQVLRAMGLVPDRDAVLKFMRREFDTHMVIELQPFQLKRLHRYVETILERQR